MGMTFTPHSAWKWLRLFGQEFEYLQPDNIVQCKFCKTKFEKALETTLSDHRDTEKHLALLQQANSDDIGGSLVSSDSSYIEEYESKYYIDSAQIAPKNIPKIVAAVEKTSLTVSYCRSKYGSLQGMSKLGTYQTGSEWSNTTIKKYRNVFVQFLNYCK
jgi:hypothetical protein